MPTNVLWKFAKENKNYTYSVMIWHGIWMENLKKWKKIALNFDLIKRRVFNVRQQVQMFQQKLIDWDVSITSCCVNRLQHWNNLFFPMESCAFFIGLSFEQATRNSDWFCQTINRNEHALKSGLGICSQFNSNRLISHHKKRW